MIGLMNPLECLWQTKIGCSEPLEWFWARNHGWIFALEGHAWIDSVAFLLVGRYFRPMTPEEQARLRIALEKQAARRGRGKAPKDGWTFPQVAALAGMPARTVRSYVERKALKQPAFFGSATRYQRGFLIRLLAIKRLRLEEKLDLAVIRKRLDAMTDAELEAFATQGIQAGPLATALGVVPPPPPRLASEGPALSPRAEEKRQRWSRVEIIDGLEISIRDDASPLARRLANQFIEDCVGVR